MADIVLLTAAEYARLRRCSLRTLDRERATGSGCPYVRLGARIFYRRSNIERYIEAHVRGRQDGRDLLRVGSADSSNINALGNNVKHPEANSWLQNDQRRIQRRIAAAGTTVNSRRQVAWRCRRRDRPNKKHHVSGSKS